MSDDNNVVSFKNHADKKKLIEKNGKPRLSSEIEEAMDDVFTRENLTGFLCILEGIRQIGDHININVDQESISIKITQFLDTIEDDIEKTSEISQEVTFDFFPEDIYLEIAPNVRKAIEMLTYWTDGENAPMMVIESDGDETDTPDMLDIAQKIVSEVDNPDIEDDNR